MSEARKMCLFSLSKFDLPLSFLSCSANGKFNLSHCWGTHSQNLKPRKLNIILIWSLWFLDHAWRTENHWSLLNVGNTCFLLWSCHQHRDCQVERHGLPKILKASDLYTTKVTWNFSSILSSVAFSFFLPSRIHGTLLIGLSFGNKTRKKVLLQAIPSNNLHKFS